jgi:hypothetical protein
MTSDLTPAEQALGDALAELGDRVGIHPGVLRPYGVAPGLLKVLRPLVAAEAWSEGHASGQDCMSRVEHYGVAPGGHGVGCPRNPYTADTEGPKANG